MIIKFLRNGCWKHPEHNAPSIVSAENNSHRMPLVGILFYFYGIINFYTSSTDQVLVNGITVTFRTVVCPWLHGVALECFYDASARTKSMDYHFTPLPSLISYNVLEFSLRQAYNVVSKNNCSNLFRGCSQYIAFQFLIKCLFSPPKIWPI